MQGNDLAINFRPITLWVLLLLLVLLVACDGEGGQTTAPTATNDLSTPTTAATPRPTATPSPTPEPTPLSPGVVIGDQVLDESGELTADEVSLPAPGWLVIYRTRDGQPDAIIGQTPLAAGLHEDVSVTVDTEAATEQLLAGVHLDVGEVGVFDFPGEDEPFPGEPEAAFTVELQIPFPQVEAVAQAVGEDGLVTLARVELLEPTWVLIHAEEDGTVGAVVGGSLLDAGVHENVTMTINWRRATPTLYVVLHEDDGKAGIMEFPDGDLPILRGGEPIVVSITATYPPEVLVYDQPIIDGAVTIERAISDGPGWVAIYNDAEGQPGFIIGTAPLIDGLNEQVTVDLLEAAITTQLHARLHQDTTPGDAFNFPGQDPPVLYDNRMPRATAFRTDRGAMAFIRDQRLGAGDTLTVDVLVSPVAAWAAIYDDAGGEPGGLLGQTFVPAGISRDIVVELDETPQPGVLHVVFYEDRGAAEAFDPAEDPALANDDNRPIRIPFALLPPAGN